MQVEGQYIVLFNRKKNNNLMIIIFVFCSSVIADQILGDSCEFCGVENCLCTRALM